MTSPQAKSLKKQEAKLKMLPSKQRVHNRLVIGKVSLTRAHKTERSFLRLNKINILTGALRELKMNKNVLRNVFLKNLGIKAKEKGRRVMHFVVDL